MKSVLTTPGLAAVLFVCLACSASLVAAKALAIDERVMRTDQPEYEKFLPPLETVALPAEQNVLAAFLAKARALGSNPTGLLAAADEALAKLPSRTKLRGMIHYARAQALSDLGRDLDASEAAEESTQLLPGYSAPLIKPFTSNAYLSRTSEVTGYLMRAISVDTTTARTIDDYEIDNLLRRLRGFHDEARLRAISDRLLQIGWIGNHVGSRSHLAVKAIELHVANRHLVPREG